MLCSMQLAVTMLCSYITLKHGLRLFCNIFTIFICTLSTLTLPPSFNRCSICGQRQKPDKFPSTLIAYQASIGHQQVQPAEQEIGSNYPSVPLYIPPWTFCSTFSIRLQPCPNFHWTVLIDGDICISGIAGGLNTIIFGSKILTRSETDKFVGYRCKRRYFRENKPSYIWSLYVYFKWEDPLMFSRSHIEFIPNISLVYIKPRKFSLLL